MEFRNLAHLTWGDYGVVIFKRQDHSGHRGGWGTCIQNRKGSAALPKALSSNPRDFEKGVTFILFPHSRGQTLVSLSLPIRSVM